MKRIIMRLVLWLIGKYLVGWHLHKDPTKRAKYPVTEQ